MDLTKIYKSFDEIPLYNFDKIDVTGDLMWLYEDFNGRQPKVDTTDLEAVYDVIFNEHFEYLEDRSIINKIQKMAQKDALELKYNAVLGLIHRIALGFTPEEQETRVLFLQQLKKWRYEIPIINSYKKDLAECKRIKQSLESIKIKIALIDSELKKQSTGESVSLQKQLIIVSQGLQLGYRINPKETTLKEWDEMLKLLQETQKAA